MNDALRHAATTPHTLTLVDSKEAETVVSYAELYVCARRVAASLIARGLRPKDRVALVLPTGREFLEAFFGVQLAGAVPVPLYPPVRLGRMDDYVQSTARMLTAVDARMVVSDRRVRLLLGAAIEIAHPPLGCPTVAELAAGTAEAECPVGPQMLGLIQFSSGSTGAPKPVALTHGNLIAQVTALDQVLTPEAGEQNIGVSWLPLYHDMGLIGCLLSAVFKPGHMVLLPPEAFLSRPSLWLRAISRHRGTVSPAPNFAYGLCLKRVSDRDLVGVDLSSWRFALNGAEPVSHATMTAFATRFGRHGFRGQAMMPVYGLSEASLAVTFTPPRARPRVTQLPGSSRPLVSVGTPLPGVEVAVCGADGCHTAEGEVGTIYTRGASVMQAYFDDPEATAQVLSNGWLDTGDLGLVDDGELFITGRAKDLVIIRGRNHAPQEFEECVDAVPGARIGCTVALGYTPDDHDGEALLILVEAAVAAPVEPVEPVEVSADATDAGARAAHARLAERVVVAVTARTGIRPHRVVVLDPGTLPRTSSGKLRRAHALTSFLAGTLAPPAPVNALTVGYEIARSLLGYARARFGDHRGAP
jgi:acyl-CoA synthetase (AMP-forming)/AMP-acid ligase II